MVYESIDYDDDDDDDDDVNDDDSEDDNDDDDRVTCLQNVNGDSSILLISTVALPMT